MGSRERMSEYKEMRQAKEASLPADDVCRKRISLLLDEASFVELDSLVKGRGIAFGFSREAVAGDGVVAGWGTIDGRQVFIAAQDPAVYGGSIGQMHAEKICKAIELARDARVPFIGLWETGGARIDEGIVALEGLGGILASLNAASGEIPLLAAVFGPCVGGAAMAAAACDFVLMCEEKSGLYMNGPMVISGVENKNIAAADIGGAKVHSSETGLAAFVAADETDLLGHVRLLLDYLPDCMDGFIYPGDSDDDPNRTDANLDQIAADLDSGYAMHEIITSVCDRDSFLEISASYAGGLITGLARFDGSVTGILANAAPRLDVAMTRKARRLIDLCERFNLPLVTLTDAEGFAISLAEEKNGLIQAGSDLLQAMLAASVPRISVIVGKATGTAYLALSSKTCGADLVYAWPTAEIAIVGADTAAHIIYRKEIAASADPARARGEFVEKYAREIAGPEVAASLGHVDEIIEPAATRPRIISAINMLTQAY